MTLLVDTDMLVAFINRREARHEAATELMKRALDGAWGAPATTDFVLDEALTLLQARGAPLSTADRVLILVFDPVRKDGQAALPLLRVGERALSDAVRHFRRHYRRGLSFTDCTTLALAAEREIEHVASFDRGFDGLLARVIQ